MEDNKKKKRTGLLLSVLGVLSLVLITAGVTYAFFNYAKEGQTVNTIKTGTITFAYTETDGINQGINISNAMPVDDMTGATVTSEANEHGKLFRFTITSQTPSTATIPYIVTVRKTAGELGNNQVKMYLEADIQGTEARAVNNTVVSGSVAGNNLVARTFQELLTLAPAQSEAMATGATETEAVVYKGSIPANQANVYTNSFILRMWLNGDENSAEGADYSPYEFMLKTKSGATTTDTFNATATCVKDNVAVAAVDSTACGTAGGVWTTTVVLPKATVSTAIPAEAAISDGSFITSTAYYALPETAGTYYYCGTTQITQAQYDDTNYACTGENVQKTTKTYTTGRNDYERIAYVTTSTSGTRSVYTLSQTLLNNTATVDPFGNYTMNTPAPEGYTATEQYYRINGASFTAIVNVYADAQVVTNP